ncbi:MAG TPA: magnesium-translocating P-type ATPase [Candidatus Limnocylindria bacterium]|nr:magnesium-translocating P-type ATPase [Candidatus Limnocylindria bacterium]
MPSLSLRDAAQAGSEAVLAALETSPAGLTQAEAARRAQTAGTNDVSHGTVRVFPVLRAQLANPFLILLATTALISLALGESTDAIIILAIVTMSVGLGFFNEYRSRAVVADLRRRLRRSAITLRDGPRVVDAAALVPGDVVLLRVGDVVPADLRLLEAHELECDEAILTGEALPASKSAEPCEPGASPLDLPSCAFLGTVVRAGSGRGVVVQTGTRTELGRIAKRVGAGLPETAFQRGLRGVTGLLVRITVLVSTIVLIVNVALRHNAVESVLFALTIAVSLTPQLLPAIVTISLATGARRMARRQVLVKRLVAIEDLGNLEVLFTDKTGTLTQGRLAFAGALDATGASSAEALRLGLLCAASPGAAVEALGLTDALDAALRRSPDAALIDLAAVRRIDEVPFDHERRRISVLLDDPRQGRILITKGAPESVLDRCAAVPPGVDDLLRARFAAGYRVIAVATRPAAGSERLDPQLERELRFAGLLVFTDPVKTDAAASIDRLVALGVRVKIVTGDNDLVAVRVCRELGIAVEGVLVGTQLDAMSDAQAQAALPGTTVFARVSPDQKARLIRLQRAGGVDVGFLGDGVNDAVALHDADVGISVESAADVARDAADVVLVTKDLGILADGIIEGRTIFANTVKYVLMATSSNFGNMLSTAGASLVLPFLPLLPSQVLLNNLLYDVSEMTIPTDTVDAEQLRRPAHWDTALIGRFMVLFGPISAVGDVATFFALLLLLHADPATFRAGYFAESFVTQTLIVFAIRTRRVPFLRSRPSRALAATTLAVTVLGVGLPFSPLAPLFGFARLPWSFVPILTTLLICYVLVVELAKTAFFRRLGIRRSVNAPRAEYSQVRNILGR